MLLKISNIEIYRKQKYRLKTSQGIWSMYVNF